MSVTVFADASRDHTNFGGWGAWAAGDGRKPMWRGGPLREQVQKINDAELFAICNGLHMVESAGYLWPSDRTVCIQSDSLYALAAILCHVPNVGTLPPKGGGSPVAPHKRGWKLSPGARRALDFVAAFAAKHGLILTVRHVRAHTGKDDGRSRVNALVDALAKTGRLKAQNDAAKQKAARRRSKRAARLGGNPGLPGSVPAGPGNSHEGDAQGREHRPGLVAGDERRDGNR